MTSLQLSAMNNVAAPTEKIGFGIDIGGSGIKGALVNLATGDFIGERIKYLTPQPATPTAVAAIVKQITTEANWTGPIGITVPSVVQNQLTHTAANIDPSWVHAPAGEIFSAALDGQPVTILNDADAAGLAEVRFGLPEAESNTAIMLTFGTGIGSAFLRQGQLFPNTELGHLLVKDMEAEHYASAAAKEREELSYKKWAKRVSRVLQTYENLFWPDVFIVGGGISRKSDKWVPLLECRTPVIPAKLRNTAGIVGAALAVAEGIRP